MIAFKISCLSFLKQKDRREICIQVYQCLFLHELYITELTGCQWLIEYTKQTREGSVLHVASVFSEAYLLLTNYHYDNK
jgi:hypothetical protein